MIGEIVNQPLKVFVSYARQDEERVKDLAHKLTVADHEVWFDQELRGGQNWWDIILDNIETSHLVIFVVSPSSVRSRACNLEVTYANDLGRPILPIMVQQTEITEAPTAVQRINFTNFIAPSEDDWIRIAADVAKTAEAASLPDPMPPRPPAPMADLSEAQRIVLQPNISTAEHRALVADLKERAPNPDERAAVVAVLDRLSEYPDIARTVAVEVDGLLIEYKEAPVDARTTELLDTVVAALQAEECTPILGTGMSDWLFGSRREHAQAWAETFRFPMASHRQADLPQVAQFLAVQKKPRQLRTELSTFYRNRLADRFPQVVDDPHEGSLDDKALAVWKQESEGMTNEPHAVLAGLPCKVYVTAEATSLLAEALIDQGKDPVVDYCRWNPALDANEWPESPLEKEPDYEPSVKRPLVYHILGTLRAPDSIVIAEDEYFDFLAEVTRNRDLIPRSVREVLADSSLLFLGFGLEDWDVRVLLRSLISPQSARRLGQFQHVAAQIDVEEANSPDDARRYIEDYFQRFRDPSIDISWSSVEEFTGQLGAAWEQRR